MAAILSIAFVFLIYWIVLFIRLPIGFTRIFQGYSLILSVFVLITYYFSYKLPGHAGILTGMGFTLLILAFSLAHKWMSGYSDNFLIGGLLPYKDAKNFYVGSNLILNGLPLENAGQASERPLFPSFFSTLLLFSGQNLKISIAILVQLTGLGLYYSSRRVLHTFGAMSASLYSTLLFFYIQPWAGYTMSEMFGFFMGCIAFSLLWFASGTWKWPDYIIGILVLLIGVSARAGTFLIFPMLVLWLGWALRGEKKFSIKVGLYATLLILIGYFAVNSLYARIMGVPPGSSFGNFSYALYGQVHGGTGWHSAIEDLGTRDPGIVYQSAFQYFLKHPFSLLIAFAKSYRDFFVPRYSNIFPFDVYSQPLLITYTIWFVVMASLGIGLFRLLKNVKWSTAAFLLTALIGVMISIPFLPPIDGGSRFYASTVPFFFVIPAIGLSKSTDRERGTFKKEEASLGLRYSAIALMFFTLIMPILTQSFGGQSLPDAFVCQVPHAAYIIQLNPDSYINLVQDEKTYCGITPDICLDDFLENNTEFKIDDFYQEIHSMMKESGMNIRLIPAINLIDRKFHYFYIDTTKVDMGASRQLASGCATEVLTKNQSIFIVESISQR